MTAEHMLWTTPNGTPMTYGDASDKTPVPRKTYRCKATATETSPHEHTVKRTHLCKLVIDHDEAEHQCLCSKKWERQAS